MNSIACSVLLLFTIFILSSKEKQEKKENIFIRTLFIACTTKNGSKTRICYLFRYSCYFENASCIGL